MQLGWPLMKSDAGMTEAEIAALLDAHDALLTACIGGSLSLTAVVAAYGGFPHSYALGESSSAGRGLSPSIRGRMAFHVQAAGVLSGAGSLPPGLDDFSGGAEDFMSQVVVVRLRQLVARHPNFTVD